MPPECLHGGGADAVRGDPSDDDEVAQRSGVLRVGEQRNEHGPTELVLPGQTTFGHDVLVDGEIVAEETLDLDVAVEGVARVEGAKIEQGDGAAGPGGLGGGKASGGGEQSPEHDEVVGVGTGTREDEPEQQGKTRAQPRDPYRAAHGEHEGDREDGDHEGAQTQHADEGSPDGARAGGSSATVRAVGQRSKRAPTWLGALAWLGLGAACGGGERATRWVPPDAALVRCTTAGRTRMPPVLMDLPVPRVPTGLLSRQLDPMALNDMGFERDQPVCGALLRPPAEVIDGARAGVTSLLASYYDVGGQVRAQLGRCACDIARAGSVVELVAPCREAPHRPSCEPTSAQVSRLVELVAPVRESLASTTVPRLHWRVAGRTDRPGWMARQLTQLLPRHTGGSTVFLPGQAVPSRHNHVLVRRLLDVAGALAVLRLDGGRSLLVVREIDDALVLDLLSFTTVDPRLVPLLPFIDEARADAVVDSLAQPSAGWTPALPLDKGNLIHLDRAALEAVDRLSLMMAPLAGIREAPQALVPPAWTPRVDAVTLQAEFGTNGKRLRAKLALNESGRQWAQTLTDGLLAPQVDALGSPVGGPRGEPAPLGIDFIYHRTVTERLLFDGISRVGSFMRKLEMNHPGALAGDLDAWDLTLPPGAVGPGGTVPAVLELRAWGERVGQQSYRLRSSFDPGREHLELVLEPG